MGGKLKIPKVSSSAARPGSITPLTDDEFHHEVQRSRVELNKSPNDLDERSDKKETNPVLSEQDHIDIKRAKENPKLTAMVKHIDNLIEKTQKVRNELSGMIQTSVELKDQCKVQEQEVALLDREQKRVGDEMNELRTKVDQLSIEKSALERKLEELKLENDELESFLSQNKQTVQEEVF